MLANLKNTFNSLQNEPIMSQNITSVAQINTALTNVTQQAASASASATAARNNANSAQNQLSTAQTLNNQLTNQEKSLSAILSKNQQEASILESYLSDFENTSFEEVVTLGNSETIN